MTDAKIAQPTDVLVKIAATNICGYVLQMYGILSLVIFG